MEAFSGTSLEWDTLIAQLPNPHLLQTWEWAQVKSKFGWSPLPLVWKESNGEITAAAMVLKRSIPVGGLAARLNILYPPKGPNLDWTDHNRRLQVLQDLQTFARKQGAIFIKIDPDVSLGTGIPGTPEAVEDEKGKTIASELGKRGWSFSRDQIQFPNTVLIDLTVPEDTMLARMKQKTRYNVRLAQKKGVKIRAAREEDLSQMYHMYAVTSIRDGFIIRGEDYYQTVWKTFQGPSAGEPGGTVPVSEPLVAEVDGEIVAAISLFYFARHAYYLFGMSSDVHREKMPNYLLQWEAMRRAKQLGCVDYNLWGAPNEFNETDRLWGVFRFKEGLGGSVARTIGAWDYPASPLLYRLYTRILPEIMAVMRRRGKTKTKHSLGEAQF